MAIHFEQMHIYAFKGIQNLAIPSLNHINILTGDNNCGKTSVLEAIQLMRNPTEFSGILRVARERDIWKGFSGSASPYDALLNLFPKNAKDLTLGMDVIYNGKAHGLTLSGTTRHAMIDPNSSLTQRPSIAYRLHQKRDSNEMAEMDIFEGVLAYSNDGILTKQPVSFTEQTVLSDLRLKRTSATKIIYRPTTHYAHGSVFGKILKDDGYKSLCLFILQIFDENISDLLLLRSEDTGRAVEYIKHAQWGNMPLSTYGDGIKKVLSIASGIADAADGVLLIDEFEMAIHAQHYEQIFSFIIKACQQMRVQLFITTHSEEAIDKMLEIQAYDAQPETDFINVITLKKISSEKRTYARILSGRETYANRENFGFEARL
ncbi:AAA family ATPase [Bengtsoniella intestinalis]|uniref:AAA family ATPase n=1 Tax=Bengtsoniella intestinalis TaxID=3073143 RepID=UPI00391F5D55